MIVRRLLIICRFVTLLNAGDVLTWQFFHKPLSTVLHKRCSEPRLAGLRTMGGRAYDTRRLPLPSANNRVILLRRYCMTLGLYIVLEN
jgi:hypothetical protein